MTAVLDTRIPAGLNADGQTPDEARQFKALQAYRAMGLLMRRIPIRTEISNWVIRDGRIEALVGNVHSDHEKRAAVMMLAEQFGLEYREDPRSDGLNMAAAVGIYAEAPVRFWQLVDPCSCGCGGAL